MSDPSGDGQHGQYAQQDPAQGYQENTPQPEVSHGKKKKRGYAAGAFDVGTGANVAAGGQAQGGGQQFTGAPSPAYGGYPQPDQQQQQQQQQPQIGAQGYPQYDSGYQSQNQPPAGAPYMMATPQGGVPYPNPPQPGPYTGVDGITQGMGSMQMGGQSGPQPQAYQQQPQLPGQQGPAAPHMSRGPLAQLYPTDLMNQPFNVSELDLPPPPINIPPNVSSMSHWVTHSIRTDASRPL